MRHLRAVVATVASAVALAGFTGALHSAGQTPAVPAGHVHTDLIADSGFESSVGGFEPAYPSDGSVALTATNPISGAQSLLVQANGYGRIVQWTDFPYEGGPFAHSVAFSAKLRVDAASEPGKSLTVCAIAYLQTSSE